MGPVTPLLAVLRKMRKLDPKLKFAWVGTPDGPEKDVIKNEGIPFYSISVAKFPRFISLRWGMFPFHYLRARKQARRILETTSPYLVVSAGAFCSVPVFHEAFKRKIPCVTHQLDFTPGLANKIMARWCTLVTTSFSYNESPFHEKDEQVTTPCRFADVPHPTVEEAKKRLGLDLRRRTVFIFGGGTGAGALNEEVESIQKELTDMAQIIHLTGKGKGEDQKNDGYQSHPVFTESQMLNAYLSADVVVCRAGLGTISELSCLKKPAILVPIPRSHQEMNAKHMPFSVVEQNELLGDSLRTELGSLLKNETRAKKMGERAHKKLPTDDGSILAKKWLKLLQK